MRTLTCSLFVVFFCLQHTLAQIPEVLWEKQYELNASCYFADVLETAYGGFLLAGAVQGPADSGYDVMLVRCNASGDTLGTVRYRNFGDDIPTKILSCNGNGYLLAFVNQGDDKEYTSRLLVLDNEFNVLWTKKAGELLAIPHTDAFVDSSGTIWWLNTHTRSGGAAEVVVSKLDSGGNLLQDIVLNDALPAEGYAIRGMPDGSFAAALKGTPAGKNSSVRIVRFTDNGTITWQADVDGEGRCLTPQCLCCAPDNNLVIGGWAGLCYNPDAPEAEQIWDYDYLLIKLDEKGNPAWRKFYNREGSEKGTAVAVLPDGKILAGGKCETSFSGKVGPWLMLIDGNGNQLSEQLFKFCFVKDQVARLIATSDGGVLMVGPGFTDANVHQTGWVRKLNPILQ